MDKLFTRVMGQKRMARLELALMTIVDHETAKGNRCKISGIAYRGIDSFVRLDVFVNGGIGGGRGYSFRRFLANCDIRGCGHFTMPIICDDIVQTVEHVARLVGTVPYEKLNSVIFPGTKEPPSNF